MQKSNIKMKNDRLKFKNELKTETTNHTNDTNINCSLERWVLCFELKKLFVKFVQFVVKRWVVLGEEVKMILQFYMSFCFLNFDI
jgi:hypothetical protein